MSDHASSDTHDPSRAPALRLAAMLFVIGGLHFLVPRPFDSIVPPRLPGRARTYTYLSGVAEIGVAATVAAPRTRRIGGKLAALLFVAVFPANIQFAADSLGNPKAAKTVKIVSVLRLPLQIPLIRHALSVSRRAPRS